MKNTRHLRTHTDAPPPPVVNPLGFDLYSTKDGAAWRLESEDGLEDPWNYGVRSFVTDPATGDLYLGTANPFFGCQVWRKRAATSCLPKWRQGHARLAATGPEKEDAPWRS